MFKISSFVSLRRKLYRFKTTWGWVNDRIFMFEWTRHLFFCIVLCVSTPHFPICCVVLLKWRMNHLSLSELCCLFCCPPCPSRIASKLAFLPPEPTYTLMCDESGSRWTLHLSERADWQYSAREKDAIECFMTRTSRGNRIACMFVRCSPNARYTLLFSHGNAVDLGQMSSFYIGLGSRINCNVFSYDYSGYGASSGKPSEKNLYADVDAAWHALRTRWGYTLKPLHSGSCLMLFRLLLLLLSVVFIRFAFCFLSVSLHFPIWSHTGLLPHFLNRVTLFSRGSKIFLCLQILQFKNNFSIWIYFKI